MGHYFPDDQSLFARVGAQTQASLECIVRRYVERNPPHPLTFRAFDKRGIIRGKDFRYHADFDAIFPHAKPGQFVYAWAKHFTAAPTELKFDVSCSSPMVIYCNGAVVFKSNYVTERYPEQRHTIFIPLQTGWNHLVVRFEKTVAGFGGIFGTWLGKHAYYFLMPTPQREGQEGWIFTDPVTGELPSLPGPGVTEANSNLKWHPRLDWEPSQRQLGQLHRIYGLAPNSFAVGWTKATFNRSGTGNYKLTGSHRGAISVWIGDAEVFSAAGSGKIAADIRIPSGTGDVIVKCSGGDSDWGFDLSITDGNTAATFSSPCNIEGTRDPWIFAGPFLESSNQDPLALRNLNNLIPSSAGKTYWRVDAPDMWVRQYNDNPLYGQWNYPLGVTLRGLLATARALKLADIEQYVVGHIRLCIDTFPFALWDREQFGGATNVLPLLTSIDSLDDCGSFGSAMLETARHAQLDGYRPIADYVADFIFNRQDRLPDGTFCRRKMMHIFHQNTMWADDLYMSVPFLCRYYELRGDSKFIDDAARQFEGFKKRLYIPGLKIMSHIYDLARDKATQVPWGRANGWTIFSLTELLAVLPKDHPRRDFLLDFFRDFCQGLLPLQDSAGMWHQVLTHPDAYPEASCTSMFAYAFARGVRFGWIENPAPYIAAVFKAWEALNKICIDRDGNVHGVCRGSEFSFSPEYYKHDLLPNLNDTHGVGIVLLAGVEVGNLMEFTKDKSK
jgi:unsaturated rhamnogalacturonyl hydrolase